MVTGRCPHVVFNIDGNDDLYGECPGAEKRYLFDIDVMEDSEGYTFDNDDAYVAFLQIINAPPNSDVAF
jgi:hypothetical protein